MPVLKLVGPESEILRTPTERMPRKLTKADKKAIKNMMKTLDAMPDAIALAAPQVGIPLRAFVVRSKTDIDAILDPEIIWTSTANPTEVVLGQGNTPIPRMTSSWERCLSFPGHEFLIERPYIVTLKFRNLKGVERKMSYQAWPARVILHEMAHLEGILLPDRASSSKIVSDDDDAEMWSF
jgi:peptide deformylase